MSIAPPRRAERLNTPDANVVYNHPSHNRGGAMIRNADARISCTIKHSSLGRCPPIDQFVTTPQGRLAGQDYCASTHNTKNWQRAGIGAVHLRAPATTPKVQQQGSQP